MIVSGELDEPSTVKVNGQPARMLTATQFEATVTATVGANQFTVTATDGSGNTRTSTYESQVTGEGSTYTYDLSGNLTTKVVGGQTWVYTWNALNQLLSVTRDGASVATFAYDPLGRRVEKTTPVSTTGWTYDGLDILREIVTTSGTPVTSLYVHGPGIDEPLLKETGTTEEYHHADGLGSVVKLTNGTGAITHTYRYDAWGNITEGATRPGMSFTGREWDPELGLYYYRARYYDATVGRFISEDAIGLAGGINLYSYTSRPTDQVDPLGLFNTWAHKRLINHSFSGFLSAREISTLGAGSTFADSGVFQEPGYSYMHAMRDGTRQQGAAAAEVEYNRFVERQLEIAVRLHDMGDPEGALFQLGMGMHALMDNMSPSHSGFQPWRGLWYLKDYIDLVVLHSPGKLVPTREAFDRANRELQMYYSRFKRRVRCR